MTTISISPAQCKAARALAGFSRRELSELSGVSKAFIYSFENYKIQYNSVSAATILQIKTELQKQSCVFIELTGVRLRIIDDLAKKPTVQTVLGQRYVDGLRVDPEHLCATDFERIGKHVSSDNFIFDEKARTAYVELELHNGAATSASLKSSFQNNDALGFDTLRQTLRAKAYLDAFFTLKRSGHIA